MRISTAYDAGKLVIRLAGELDHHGAREAMREIDGLIDEYLPRDTALDMELSLIHILCMVSLSRQSVSS